MSWCEFNPHGLVNDGIIHQVVNVSTLICLFYYYHWVYSSDRVLNWSAMVSSTQ